MHIYMLSFIFGFGMGRNLELNGSQSVGRYKDRGITPDQLPLFLDMARLCNSVFYPEHSDLLDNRCTLLVMHYFRKEYLYDKKFNKNAKRRQRRSAGNSSHNWNQYNRNYNFPNHDSDHKCQRRVFEST